MYVSTHTPSNLSPSPSPLFLSPLVPPFAHLACLNRSVLLCEPVPRRSSYLMLLFSLVFFLLFSFVFLFFSFLFFFLLERTRKVFLSFFLITSILLLPPLDPPSFDPPIQTCLSLTRGWWLVVLVAESVCRLLGRKSGVVCNEIDRLNLRSRFPSWVRDRDKTFLGQVTSLCRGSYHR